MEQRCEQLTDGGIITLTKGIKDHTLMDFSLNLDG